jgi:hypothetical protein
MKKASNTSLQHHSQQLNFTTTTTTTMMKHESILSAAGSIVHSPQSQHRSRNSLAQHNMAHLKLPYELSVDSKRLSIQQWLSNLDILVDDCKQHQMMYHNHSNFNVRPQSDHLSTDVQEEDHQSVNERKHSLDYTQEEEGDESLVAQPPRRKRQRRNSFVIHRDAHGHSMSLLGADFQEFLREENAKDDYDDESDK